MILEKRLLKILGSAITLSFHGRNSLVLGTATDDAGAEALETPRIRIMVSFHGRSVLSY